MRCRSKLNRGNRVDVWQRGYNLTEVEAGGVGIESSCRTRVIISDGWSLE
jgi:hypothetical protein